MIVTSVPVSVVCVPLTVRFPSITRLPFALILPSVSIVAPVPVDAVYPPPMSTDAKSTSAVVATS